MPITRNHLDTFRKFAGTPYDSNNQQHIEVKEKINSILGFIDDCCRQVSEKMFGEYRISGPRHCVNPAANTTFKSYLSRQIRPTNRYSELLVYWCVVEGRAETKFDFKVVLDVMERNTSINTQTKMEELRSEYKLETFLSIENEITSEGFIDWLTQSIESFKMPYSDVCDQIKDLLESDLNDSTKNRDDSDQNTDVSEEDVSKELSLNTILYGPPGTGKTYATIDAALNIVDPDFLSKHPESLDSDWSAKNERRKLLKQRFDQLVNDRLIRFVTFHQSYSYEDFVEGIRAEVVDRQNIYKIESGVFKSICDDARTHGQQPEVEVQSNSRVWKISIDGTGDNPTKNYCFNHDQARIGWGETGDLKESFSSSEYFQTLGSGSQGTLRYFSEEISEGDILICIHSSEEIAGVGVVTGGYYYDNNPPTQIRPDFKHVLPVKWLYKNLSLPIYQLNDSKRFVQKTVYLLDRVTWADLLPHIQKHGLTPQSSGINPHKPKPHVLIIDEINRGNISRVFGELISLIEPSKRFGASESLEVILPYSKLPFSVPSNVYLVGTMNTADRSLVGLDIALRRRFTFVEMAPKPELLDAIEIEGLKIGLLLKIINERIEVLLDRDHCLGHAYFIPLVELVEDKKRIQKLSFIFRQQILPLLEEYFFEDWERIAWVLNDQNKSQSEFKFLQNSSKNFSSLSVLFGTEIASNLNDRRWHINESAFHRIESYLEILEVKK